MDRTHKITPVCEFVHVHGVLTWSSILRSLYSSLRPSVPRMGSGSTATLTRIKCLLKMNEPIMYSTAHATLITDQDKAITGEEQMNKYF